MSSIAHNPLSPLGRAALRYATKFNWRIFPIAQGEKFPPLVKDWPNRASTDPPQIARWWHLYPEANIGLACGQGSGVVVVDVDTKADGLENWAELLDVHGAVDTLEAISGSNGQHIFFAAPDFALKNTQAEIAPGVDTRADAGYVLLSPSLNKSGPYEWATSGIPPAPIPDWLLAKWPRAEQKKAPTPRQSPNGDTEAPAGPGKRLAWTLLKGDKLPSGSTNCVLTSIAGWLRSYHPEPVVNVLLQTINEAKADPPLPPEEVESIARSVCRYPQHGVNGHPKAIVIPEGWGTDPNVIASTNPLRNREARHDS